MKNSDVNWDWAKNRRNGSGGAFGGHHSPASGITGLVLRAAGFSLLGIVLMPVVLALAGSTALAAAGLAALWVAVSAASLLVTRRRAAQVREAGFDDGMRLVMESVPMVCSLYDKDNNIKYCNEAVVKLYGFRDREEYAANYASSFPEFQPDGTKSDELALGAIAEIMESGSASVEWQQKRADGELIPLHLSLVRTHFRGEDHVMEFTTDMRPQLEIRRKENVLRERMQAILDASPLVCALFGEDGGVLEVNREVERLFDIQDKQVYIDRFSDFLPEFQPDGTRSEVKMKTQMQEALREGRCRHEMMYRRLDGTPVPVEATLYAIKIDGKKIVISYARDLREFYAAKEAEKAAQRRVADMMDRLNTHLETQSTAITESSAAVEQLIANTRSVSNTLSKNSANVKELREASSVGHSGISEVATDINEIARESESLLEINSVMHNIASQTNLLSMNAAIEAAHAGDSGRGFAVVADEIRKLAESASEQSKTIGTVLKKIKDSIDKITRSTDNVMTKFSAIDDGVKTVAEQEDGILNAMTEQGAGSTQIMQAITQVNEITFQVKEDARRMVEAAAKLGV